ncbi:hypothetical protein H6G94_09580 [Nostoc punctiforme FACHB-252]|uniref:Uncharacterized protein n=2 Tax=Nostoc punctiforme TaxID=272131 RepID=A0ABR8H7P9_NOSPU|nr:hypothetical protein [Nostoc punctiforme FACHB-252]
MFTRSELEIKTVPELRDMCRKYGIRPTGSAAYKGSYITSLLSFPIIAIGQMESERGLRLPSLAAIQVIGSAIDEMNSPTAEQAALIRISMEGRRMGYPDRYKQEELLGRYMAKMKLEEVMSLLAR